MTLTSNVASADSRPATVRTSPAPVNAGPVVIPGAGHFLQWERADIFNALVAAYFGDVREKARR